MKHILIVGAGGFIGSILRYLISKSTKNLHSFESQFLSILAKVEFPVGTFLVNTIGCFFIGALFAFCLKRDATTDFQLLWITGVLGGFTTFSSFSLEIFSLLKDGNTQTAAIYLTTSITLGLLAVAFGWYLANSKLF